MNELKRKNQIDSEQDHNFNIRRGIRFSNENMKSFLFFKDEHLILQSIRKGRNWDGKPLLKNYFQRNYDGQFYM
jgi:hypothetical protein